MQDYFTESKIPVGPSYYQPFLRNRHKPQFLAIAKDRVHRCSRDSKDGIILMAQKRLKAFDLSIGIAINFHFGKANLLTVSANLQVLEEGIVKEPVSV